MAIGKAGDGSFVILEQNTAMIISLSALLTTLLVSTMAKGIFKLVPIFCGVIVGYLLSLFFGILDFSVISAAPWLSMPKFVAPEWNWHAVLFMIPVAIAPAVEHVGDILAISNVAGKDFIKKPRSESADTVKSSVPVFKSRNIKRIAYAAVFVSVVLISYCFSVVPIL